MRPLTVSHRPVSGNWEPEHRLTGKQAYLHGCLHDLCIPRCSLPLMLLGRQYSVSFGGAAAQCDYPLQIRLGDSRIILKMAAEDLCLLMSEPVSVEALTGLAEDRAALLLEFALQALAEDAEAMTGRTLEFERAGSITEPESLYFLNLTFSSEEREFSVSLGLPPELQQEAAQLLRRHSIRRPLQWPDIPLQLSISCGWQWLGSEELRALGCGDVVILNNQHPGLWLSVQGLPAVRLRLLEPGRYRMTGRLFSAVSCAPPVSTADVLVPEFFCQDLEFNMETENTAPEPVAAKKENIPLCLTCEIGRYSLTLDELRNLGRGSVIELDNPEQELVTLRVNGRVIGCGEVVRLDDELGVRITSLSD